MIEAFLELRDIHRMFSEARRQFEQAVGVPVCIPGCGRCCQHNTPSWMTIEAIHAVSVLTGGGRLRKVVSIAEGWLLERHAQATLYEGMPVGWARPRLRDEWAVISRAQCPFLNEGMECLIYQVEPLVCRSFGLTRDTVDIETGYDTCPRPVGKGEVPSQKLVVDGSPIRQAIAAFRGRCREKNKAWLVSGLIPTVLYRVAEPERFKRLVLDNRIASAKLVGVEIETQLMWQPQVVALRQGMSPDLVVARN